MCNFKRGRGTWKLNCSLLENKDHTVDLVQIPNLNNEPILINIKSSLSQWQRHLLTPIGKIAILKSLIISKLNYLFLCILDPSDHFIKKMEQLFFEFIWDKKPDKIKRNTLCMDYSRGGLKCSTSKHRYQPLNYQVLCTYNMKSLEKLLHMGSLYCAKIIDKNSNKFWADILYIWKRLLHNQIGSAQSCLTCPLWYNPNISERNIFPPTMLQSGVIYPIDQCNRDGNMLTLEEVRKNYHVNLHFIDYYRLQSGLGKLIKTQCTNSENLIPEKPIWPATLSLIHKSKKGCKDFYDVLRQKSQDSLLHTKCGNSYFKSI